MASGRSGTCPKLIVALDVAKASDVSPTLARLGDTVDFYKIGLELFCAAGPAVLASVQEAGKQAFLDLKLHDIPRTVARTVRTLSRRGAALTTLHAAGGRSMLEAAVEAAREAGDDAPALLAVTVLTSLDAGDFRDMGLHRSPEDQVLALAELALDAGVDGVVCSPREARAVRARFGAGPLIVTPGIRPAGDGRGDQKRVATPADAVRAGATHLVVGRPILEASDPKSAASAVREEMAGAFLAG